jgi:TPR repeat protein
LPSNIANSTRFLDEWLPTEGSRPKLGDVAGNIHVRRALNSQIVKEVFSFSSDRVLEVGKQPVSSLQDLETLLATHQLQLEKDPKNANLRCEKAKLHLLKGDGATAEAELYQALADNRNHSEVRYNYAMLCEMGIGGQMNPDLARYMFHSLLEEGYEPAWLHSDSNPAKPSALLKIREEQLEEDSKNADLHCEVARLNHRLKQDHKATRHIGEALKIQADHKEARYLAARSNGMGLGTRVKQAMARALLEDLIKEGYEPAVRLLKQLELDWSDSSIIREEFTP